MKDLFGNETMDEIQEAAIWIDPKTGNKMPLLDFVLKIGVKSKIEYYETYDAGFRDGEFKTKDKKILSLILNDETEVFKCDSSVWRMIKLPIQRIPRKIW